jgi:hypothetical protein
MPRAKTARAMPPDDPVLKDPTVEKLLESLICICDGKRGPNGEHIIHIPESKIRAVLNGVARKVRESMPVQAETPAVAPTAARPKARSRPDRFSDACSRAEAALEELVDLQGEYQEWRDNMPDNLDGSPTAEKLDAVCELDLEGAKSTIEEANGLDLPRGFGQD